MKSSLRVTASFFGIVALWSAVPAMAADAQPAPNGKEDIIVTAQRRSEKSRDVPISVTTLNPQQLATANVNQLSDVTKLTPSLRFDAAGSNVQPTIRGVGTAIATSGAGPNVGIYVDGFFQANPAVADFQLMKVQNIQVLEGPQGTLFGRNTTGGAILVTTADPSTKTSGEIKASYGSFNTINAQAYATFGITKDVAFDVEGIIRHSDGYVRDISTSDPYIGKSTNWSVRTGLKAQLSDNVSVLLRYAHSDVDDPSNVMTNAYVDATGGAGFMSKVSTAGQTIYGTNSSAGLPLVYFYTPTNKYATEPGTSAATETPIFKDKSDSFQGTIKADLGFANLTSYTQYRSDKSINYQELGATAYPSFYIYIGVDDATFSQEFLLNSKPGSRLQWTLGANYFQNRDTWDVRASLPTVNSGAMGPFGGSSTTSKSLAGFADLTYQLTDKLFLTAGGRYSHDVVSDAYFITNLFTPYTGYTLPDGSFSDCSMVQCGAGTVVPVNDLTNDSFTPRVVLRYKPTQESSIYASYTKGFKAGILNVGGLSEVPVQPEKINAYELGYKFSNGTFSADLAGFYYDYKNLQVSSYQSGAAQIRNAASAEIYGLEAQFRYSVSKDFNLTGGASWTHARYKSFANAPYYSYCDPTAAYGTDLYCTNGTGTLAQTTTNASGYHMQRAPDFTGNIGASYAFDLAEGRMTLSGNLYYTSSFYFDPEQQFKQNGYEILSLRAQWVDPTKRYTLAVFGDNVTGERYQTQVLFNTVGIGSTWSSPATWGVSLGAKF